MLTDISHGDVSNHRSQGFCRAFGSGALGVSFRDVL